MDTIVGAVVTVGLGVIVIAGIYQLGKAPTLTQTAGTAYGNTLTSLFKG